MDPPFYPPEPIVFDALIAVLLLPLSLSAGSGLKGAGGLLRRTPPPQAFLAVGLLAAAKFRLHMLWRSFF